MNTTLELGIQIIQALQSLGDWLVPIMKVITFLGSEDFFLFFLPVLYWAVDTRLGLRVGIILLFSSGLNGILKLAFHGPRPYWYSTAVTAHAAETSFGVPSGHSQTAVSVWGFLAGSIKRRWAWAIAILLMALIGLSRLVLAVHFPHDVLLGWTIGALTVWGFMAWWDKVAAWLQKLGFRNQVLFAFFVSLVMISLAVIPYLSLQDWVIPQTWLEVAVAAGVDELPAPVSLSGILTSAGTLFGMALGAAWMNTRGGFDASGAGWKRVFRYFLGLIGVVVFYFGLKLIFPSGENLAAFVARYIRYALVGVWVTGMAPALFIRLKLAKPPHK